MSREELLSELSSTLGVKVLDVERIGAQWHLELPCAPEICVCRLSLSFEQRRGLPMTWCPPFPHGRWLTAGKSGEFRNPKRLTAFARRHGRPADQRPLVAEDGHRVIRLMFDIYRPRESS